VSGSGSTYTVSVATTGVTGGNTNNTISLNVANATSVKDQAGNGLSTGNLPFTGQSYVYDTTAPTLSSVNRAGTSPTNAGPLTWTVTFSESVSGVSASNFSTTAGTGITGTLGTPSVSGSGSTYTVSVATTGVTGGNTNNTVTLKMANATGVNDLAGNNLSTTNIPFAGQSYTYDTTKPTGLSASCSFGTGDNLSCSGAAGNANGDIASVTVKIFTSGGVDTGKSYTESVSGTSWSVPSNSSGLGKGTYFAVVSQSDTAGNTGTAQSATFTRS